jgi:hypothetical protein
VPTECRSRSNGVEKILLRRLCQAPVDFEWLAAYFG